jgi:hypothetical protein
LSRAIDFSLNDDVEITVARMQRLRNPGFLVGVFPDFAEPVIGRRFAPTRWPYPSRTRIVVTLAPIGCAKISDNVRQLPSLHPIGQKQG